MRLKSLKTTPGTQQNDKMMWSRKILPSLGKATPLSAQARMALGSAEALLHLALTGNLIPQNY